MGLPGFLSPAAKALKKASPILNAASAVGVPGAGGLAFAADMAGKADSGKKKSKKSAKNAKATHAATSSQGSTEYAMRDGDAKPRGFIHAILSALGLA